jgi:polyhydroxybutyrate depolymerase
VRRAGNLTLTRHSRTSRPRWGRTTRASIVLVVIVVTALLIAPDGARSPSPASGRPALLRSARVTPADRRAPTVPPAPSGWTITAKRLVSDGRWRYYLLARPAHPATRDLPVVVILHGRDMTPAGIEQRTGFLGLVGPALVAYPAGFDQSWNAGYCCGAAHRAGIDDVAFLENVIAQILATEPPAPTHPVYLVGYSNGGRMAYQLACSDPGAFSGVAAVEAVAVSTCNQVRPVPLIEVASSGDPLLTIPASGHPKHIAGHVEPTVTALVRNWRQLEGCAPASTPTTYPALQITEWSHCDAPGRVALAVYQGGSHHWPAGGAATPSASQLIWDFFQHPAPESASAPTRAGTNGAT